MKRLGLKTLALLLLVASGWTEVRADTLWFSSGRSIKVLILSETDDSITFKQGKSTVTFKKSTLKRIERDSPEENDRIRAEWRQKYFDADVNVPEELKGMATRFRALKKACGNALDADRQIDSCVMRRQVAAIRAKEIDENSQRIVAQLKKLSPSVDAQIKKCNELAGEINSLTIELNGLIKRNNSGDRERINSLLENITRLRQQWKSISNASAPDVEKQRALQKKVQDMFLEVGKLKKEVNHCTQEEARLAANASSYMKLVEEFRREVDEKKTAALRQAYPEFFESLDAGFASMVAGMKTDKIAVSKKDGSIHVKALINGTEEVTLVFDTGATVTTLSREVAVRLGILPEKEGLVKAVLADGKEVDATPVVLDSLSVGSASRKYVSALILDRAPGPDVDGLLGMSFLKYFTIRFNATHDQIELIHL